MSAAAGLEPPVFPPLMRGERASPGQDPLASAVARAALGTDPGLVVWGADREDMSAAIVLAPEVARDAALAASQTVALGLGDALGALAPPEVAVHFDWPGGIRVNGAPCARLRVALADGPPDAAPDWMVAGIEIGLAPPEGRDPGWAERTWLSEEGCAAIGPEDLVEAWARHSLVWLNSWMDRGIEPLHEAWRARAWGLGEALAGGGVFVGLDEHLGQLVKQPHGTELRRLADHLLEAA